MLLDRDFPHVLVAFSIYSFSGNFGFFYLLLKLCKLRQVTVGFKKCRYISKNFHISTPLLRFYCVFHERSADKDLNDEFQTYVRLFKIIHGRFFSI